MSLKLAASLIGQRRYLPMWIGQVFGACAGANPTSVNLPKTKGYDFEQFARNRGLRTEVA